MARNWNVYFDDITTIPNSCIDGSTPNCNGITLGNPYGISLEIIDSQDGCVWQSGLHSVPSVCPPDAGYQFFLRINPDGTITMYGGWEFSLWTSTATMTNCLGTNVFNEGPSSGQCVIHKITLVPA